MPRGDVVCRHAGGKGLFEAPCYIAGIGLVFSDARAGGVFVLRDAGDVRPLLAHRRGIGGIAIHEQGGYIVTGRNLAYKRDDLSSTVVLLDQDPAVDRNGFNDLTTDTTGRVYVGFLGEVAIDNDQDPSRLPGGVYLIDLDGSGREVVRGIALVNGMALSPTGTSFYVSDSTAQTVLVYDVDRATGLLGEPSVLAKFDSGAPDGMAVSDDGRIWVALARTGRVHALRPDGSTDYVLELPVPLVTSLAFGGTNGSTLFVTTGAEDDDDPHDAAIFSAELDGVTGLPVCAARTALGTV